MTLVNSSMIMIKYTCNFFVFSVIVLNFNFMFPNVPKIIICEYDILN